MLVQGGSNGGLLMGATLNQHPSMFAAVIAQVGVYDMLRYQLFTIGHAWITEYGDPANETMFEYLYKYSPLHNVRVPAGTHQYPATMLTTGQQPPQQLNARMLSKDLKPYSHVSPGPLAASVLMLTVQP